MEALTINVDRQLYPVLSLPGRPKALLDRTVAAIYEVETRAVNQAVKNNAEKFPPDFYFELTPEETRSLNEIKNFDLAWKGGYLPKAYTHLGCNMLATVLKSEIAVRRAVEIIRAFTALEGAGIVSQPRDVLQMISAQSRMIAVLADEMYTNRRQIEDHDYQLKSLNSRLSAVENQKIARTDSETISAGQAGILRDMVKTKAQNRKQIIRIWFAFKRHFDLTRYQHLPKNKLDEAREWIKNWTPGL